MGPTFRIPDADRTEAMTHRGNPAPIRADCTAAHVSLGAQWDGRCPRAIQVHYPGALAVVWDGDHATVRTRAPVFQGRGCNQSPRWAHLAHVPWGCFTRDRPAAQISRTIGEQST